MLALADRFGFVSASVPGLASLARISKEKCEEALTTLSSPDPDSRSTAHEGRRIEKVEGGWNLLNYETYRRKLSAEERREYNAMKQREHRAKVKESAMSLTGEQSVHIAEAEAEADTEAEANTPTANVPLLGSPEFKTFFEAYPLKTKRTAALHEWCKQRLDSLAGEVLLSLGRWKSCERWKDEQFIPYASNWLADQWKSVPVKGAHEQKRERTKQAIERVRAGMD